jgi:hypothetical protein
MIRPKRVEDQDPIKHLQSLLTDRNKVLERISGIRAMLDSIKAPASSAALPESIPTTTSLAPAPREEPYDRLLHVLRDMQSEIENQVRPLAQQAIDFEVQRVREQAAIDQRDLRTCVEQIDRCVSACVQHAHEYRREHAELARFNGRLAALGSAAEPLPECPSEITEIISSRLQWLHVQQKI